jgi:U3 small nucleolar RNA-associated protein 25
VAVEVHREAGRELVAEVVEPGAVRGLHAREAPGSTVRESPRKKSMTFKMLLHGSWSLTCIFRSSGSESEDTTADVPDIPEDLVDSDEEDEEDVSTARPYMSLMRSLVESAPPKSKRRKLDHKEAQETPQQQIKEEQPKEKDRDGNSDVDHVEEPEETPEEAAVEEDLFDEDDDLDASDPFETHFADPDDTLVSPRLKAIKEGQWQMKRTVQNTWRLFINTPGTGNADAQLPKSMSGPADLKLKRKLQESISKKWTAFDQVETLLAPLIFNQLDTLFCERTLSNSANLRRMACLHALNHVFK